MVWRFPLIWLPVVCWCLTMSIQMGHTLREVGLMMVFGIFIWTLIEYTCAPVPFPHQTKRQTHVIIFFMDAIISIQWTDFVLFSLRPQRPFFWNLVRLISTPSTTPALFGGGLLGYVMYDCTHYYLHHGQPTSDPAKNLKRYHLNHHFRIQNKGFGITSSLWDVVFGTLPPSKMAGKSIPDAAVFAPISSVTRVLEHHLAMEINSFMNRAI
ncbi:Fatty acid 2-hydroxylase 1, partial [Ananas comosus]